MTGYEHKRVTQNGLWQESYYDHVLRDDDETWRAVRYALENPVRKRLVSDWWEYPGCGSDVWNREQMEELGTGPQACLDPGTDRAKALCHRIVGDYLTRGWGTSSQQLGPFPR